MFNVVYITHTTKFIARSPVRSKRGEVRAGLWRPVSEDLSSERFLASFILTCTIPMCHAYNDAYQVDRHLLTRPRFRSFRNIRSLSLSYPPYHPSPFFPVYFFYVPSEPHAHGCARLKIWNQCDQNGCYGRAPVYRTVSIRPGASPAREKFCLTIAPRTRVCSNERMIAFRSHLDPTDCEYYDLKD